jgi:uncharacterized surface protein with fasciclin (FAS1) repeats
MKKLMLMSAAAALVLTWAVPAEAGGAKEKNCVDVAVAAGTFKTLVAALQAGGLDGTLKGKGPFTIFAPTDEAFARLPAGALDGLKKDKDKLQTVLKYHVVSGKLMAKDVVAKPELTTVQGGKLAVATDGGASVNGIKISATDISCANGVIHVIDGVLMPK